MCTEFQFCLFVSYACIYIVSDLVSFKTVRRFNGLEWIKEYKMANAIPVGCTCHLLRGHGNVTLACRKKMSKSDEQFTFITTVLINFIPTCILQQSSPCDLHFQMHLRRHMTYAGFVAVCLFVCAIEAKNKQTNKKRKENKGSQSRHCAQALNTSKDTVDAEIILEYYI